MSTVTLRGARVHETTFDPSMLIFVPAVYMGGAKVQEITFEDMSILEPAVKGVEAAMVSVVFALEAAVLKPLRFKTATSG